jgi:adenylate cyclase
MSGDPTQDYFSDGLTNDLTTDLSRLPDLFVIAPSSAFTYKGKPTKLQNVSRELGVKYVLEGGVRRAGDQVRITVQLADATTGGELWAERYDRPLRDVFALQDEIVRRIVTTLNLQLTLAQQGVLIPRTTENFEAYDDVLRGAKYFLGLTKDGNAKARPLFKKAIALDPKYATAYMLLGWNYFLGEELLLTPNSNGLELAFQMGQDAIALDDSNPEAHSLLAGLYSRRGQFDQAAAEAQRSIALDPNSAIGYSMLANVMNVTGKPAEALVAAEKAIRLDPLNAAHHLYELGSAYSQLGRYEEAIPVFKRELAFSDGLWDHVDLVRDYTELGQEDAARAEAVEVQRRSALDPNSPVGYLARALVLDFMGESAQALVAVQKAMSLDPGHPDTYLTKEGFAYQGLGRYEEAVAAFKRHLALHPGMFLDHLGLAIDYIELGRDDEARAEAVEVLKLNPQFSLKMFFRTVGRKDKAVAQDTRWSADLRKAGLQ